MIIYCRRSFANPPPSGGGLILLLRGLLYTVDVIMYFEFIIPTTIQQIFLLIG